MIGAKEETIQGFIDMIEAKDIYTRGHSHHVRVVTDKIYDCLPARIKSAIDKDALSVAALLHDIGKTMTPDYVLNKEGSPLSEEEWEIMRRHPEDGRRIIENTEFKPLADWVKFHHERPDGRGYYGLIGDTIPIEARIISIADTFSALRTYRIYRPAIEIGKAVSIMRECAGTQLDAELLGCFLALDIATLEALECNCEICILRRQELADRLAAAAL